MSLDKTFSITVNIREIEELGLDGIIFFRVVSSLRNVFKNNKSSMKGR
jgi:hypothetical protein